MRGKNDATRLGRHRLAFEEVVDLLVGDAEGVLVGMWAKYAPAWSRGGDALAEPVFFDEVDAVLTRWLGVRTPVIV